MSAADWASPIKTASFAAKSSARRSPKRMSMVESSTTPVTISMAATASGFSLSWSSRDSNASPRITAGTVPITNRVIILRAGRSKRAILTRSSR